MDRKTSSLDHEGTYQPESNKPKEQANQKGIKALAAENLKKLFITHLHSDHTTGYDDIIFTPAVLDRRA